MDGSTNPRFGAIDFAHWFFPLRGGGGAVGGMLGAFKMVRQGWGETVELFSSQKNGGVSIALHGRFWVGFGKTECVFFLMFTDVYLSCVSF